MELAKEVIRIILEAGKYAYENVQANSMKLLSANTLKQIVPHCRNPATIVGHLNEAMEEAEINTDLRQAAFIAQLAHESGSFRYMEELASGAAYEGRKDLGNIFPGDGIKYKGRGFIQVTGRANYSAASKALGVDFVANPELAATYENAARIAAWYWNSRNLNPLADRREFHTITRRINGGLNGIADRLQYYERALRVLGEVNG